MGVAMQLLLDTISQFPG